MLRSIPMSNLLHLGDKRSIRFHYPIIIGKSLFGLFLGKKSFIPLTQKGVRWLTLPSRCGRISGGGDTNMKPLSYTQLQDKYSGKFVATYKGEVIASAKTSKKLFEKIKDKLGDKNLLIHHVDPKEAVCVY